MNILEDLWYGNVHPMENRVEIDKYKQMCDALGERESELLKCIGEKNLDVFESYYSALVNVHSADECAAFVKGFRIGALMMLEAAL